MADKGDVKKKEVDWKSGPHQELPVFLSLRTQLLSVSASLSIVDASRLEGL